MYKKAKRDREGAEGAVVPSKKLDAFEDELNPDGTKKDQGMLRTLGALFIEVVSETAPTKYKNHIAALYSNKEFLNLEERLAFAKALWGLMFAVDLQFPGHTVFLKQALKRVTDILEQDGEDDSLYAETLHTYNHLYVIFHARPQTGVTLLSKALDQCILTVTGRNFLACHSFRTLSDAERLDMIRKCSHVIHVLSEGGRPRSSTN